VIDADPEPSAAEARTARLQRTRLGGTEGDG